MVLVIALLKKLLKLDLLMNVKVPYTFCFTENEIIKIQELGSKSEFHIFLDWSTK